MQLKLSTTVLERNTVHVSHLGLLLEFLKKFLSKHAIVL